MSESSDGSDTLLDRLLDVKHDLDGLSSGPWYDQILAGKALMEELRGLPVRRAPVPDQVSRLLGIPVVVATRTEMEFAYMDALMGGRQALKVLDGEELLAVLLEGGR